MKKDILIKKSDGTLAPFRPDKVLASITRTGVDKATGRHILTRVQRKLTPNMTTKEIYAIVRSELEKRRPWAAARFDLRKAIINLGPAGFNFEKYVAAVLDAYGYTTQTPDTYQGACISHEIDVTAEKDGRMAFIEAKFRHDFKATITIKDTMATWARFLDLVDGSKIGQCPHFDEVWIVTNARFTDQSLQWGHCKNMKLIGWNHPEERTFAQMVDLDALYPITILKDLSKTELETFALANLILCRDLGNLTSQSIHKRTGIDLHRIEKIMSACEEVVSGHNA
jgi:hypothetical protein